MILSTIQKVVSGECSLAIQCTNQNNYSAVDDTVGRLFEIWNEHHDELAGACVTEKFIGKASAALLCSSNVGEVYGITVTAAALDMMKKNGIRVSCKTLADNIPTDGSIDCLSEENALSDCESVDACTDKLRKIFGK